MDICLYVFRLGWLLRFFRILFISWFNASGWILNVLYRVPVGQPISFIQLSILTSVKVHQVQIIWSKSCGFVAISFFSCLHHPSTLPRVLAPLPSSSSSLHSALTTFSLIQLPLVIFLHLVIRGLKLLHGGKNYNFSEFFKHF